MNDIKDLVITALIKSGGKRQAFGKRKTRRRRGGGEIGGGAEGGEMHVSKTPYLYK